MIVEDDADIRQWLCLELQHEGCEAWGFADGESALAACAVDGFDVVLLDVVLPGISGVETCRRLRGRTAVPVLLVTARDAVPDRVAGLDAGADDYIPKPFAIEELLARIRVQLRRAGQAAAAAPPAPEVLVAGSLSLDTGTRAARVDGQAVQLSKTEFELLAYLMRNAGIVRPREAILREVWNYDFAGDSKVVDVYVRYLRAKIDERFRCPFIHTVRSGTPRRWP